jgi:hypothetical protein
VRVEWITTHGQFRQHDGELLKYGMSACVNRLRSQLPVKLLLLGGKLVVLPLSGHGPRGDKNRQPR